jgi:hypothetical protein
MYQWQFCSLPSTSIYSKHVFQKTHNNTSTHVAYRKKTCCISKKYMLHIADGLNWLTESWKLPKDHEQTLIFLQTLNLVLPDSTFSDPNCSMNMQILYIPFGLEDEEIIPFCCSFYQIWTISRKSRMNPACKTKRNQKKFTHQEIRSLSYFLHKNGGMHVSWALG